MNEKIKFLWRFWTKVVNQRMKLLRYLINGKTSLKIYNGEENSGRFDQNHLIEVSNLAHENRIFFAKVDCSSLNTPIRRDEVRDFHIII